MCLSFRFRVDVVNVFALRSTDPAALSKHPDPRGPENENYLLNARRKHGCSSLVVAWVDLFIVRRVPLKGFVEFIFPNLIKN